MKEEKSEGREGNGHRVAKQVCKTVVKVKREWRKGRKGRDSHLNKDPCRGAFQIFATSPDSGCGKEEHVSRASIDW